MLDMDEDDVTSELEGGDLDDGYAEGDPDLADIDPESLERLATLQAEVLATPEGEARNWANLALLDNLYGEGLELV